MGGEQGVLVGVCKEGEWCVAVGGYYRFLYVGEGRVNKDGRSPSAPAFIEGK